MIGFFAPKSRLREREKIAARRRECIERLLLDLLAQDGDIYYDDLNRMLVKAGQAPADTREFADALVAATASLTEQHYSATLREPFASTQMMRTTPPSSRMTAASRWASVRS